MAQFGHGLPSARSFQAACGEHGRGIDLVTTFIATALLLVSYATRLAFRARDNRHIEWQVIVAPFKSDPRDARSHSSAPFL
jgi:hypothetical protein